MDIIAAYREMGSYRGAAAICGTTHKSVKRIIEAEEALGAGTPPVPARVVRARNFDHVTALVADKVKKTQGRISAKRLLPAPRAARKAVAEFGATLSQVISKSTSGAEAVEQLIRSLARISTEYPILLSGHDHDSETDPSLPVRGAHDGARVAPTGARTQPAQPRQLRRTSLRDQAPRPAGIPSPERCLQLVEIPGLAEHRVLTTIIATMTGVSETVDEDVSPFETIHEA